MVKKFQKKRDKKKNNIKTKKSIQILLLEIDNAPS